MHENTGGHILSLNHFALLHFLTTENTHPLDDASDGGGPTAVHPNGWHEYKPMAGQNMGNVGICGDRAGSNAHMRSGIYANPASNPFSAVYPPGGVVDLTWYMNANHKGSFLSTAIYAPIPIRQSYLLSIERPWHTSASQLMNRRRY